jgi:uncharacterized protein (DUF697 family)
MRHYNVPRLNSISYYVVFCDCGHELRRFYDDETTGKEQFDNWQTRALEADRQCRNCFQQQPQSPATIKDQSSLSGYLDELAATIQSAIGSLDFTHADLYTKREAAKNISHIAATICAAIALQPVPIADVLLLTPIQILLVQSIGRIYNVPLSTKTAYEIATNIGLGVVLRQIFVAAVKMGMPLMGGLLCSTYVYSSTFYMGKVAQIYFEKGRPLTAEELEQAQSSRSRAEERLRELEQVMRAGLITEVEFQQKRKQIVDEI